MKQQQQVDPKKVQKVLNIVINILSAIAGALGAIIVQGCA